MSEIDELRKRLDETENTLNRVKLSIVASKRIEIMEHCKDFAGLEALVIVVSELAQRAGISKDSFWKHYKLRRRYCLDRRLKEMEDEDPMIAAEIDTRDAGDFDFPDSIPPLFEDPSDTT